MRNKVFNNMVGRMFLLSSVVVVSGCASVTYEEPKSGPLARVRFTANTKSGMTIVRGYASNQCDGEQEMMRLREGFLFRSDPRTLGMPLWNYHENAAKEFYIRAGTPQTYIFSGDKMSGNSIYTCGVVLQQKFEEGKDYELNYQMNLGCRVSVYELVKNSSGNVEKILLQEKNNILSKDFSSKCLAKFKELRLY